MKHSLKLIGIPLLLLSCSMSQPTAPDTAEQERVPDLEATLPPEQEMAVGELRPAGVSAQASELPAWKGPLMFGFRVFNKAGNSQLGVSAIGRPFVNTVFGGTGGVYYSKLHSFKADGTSFAPVEGPGGRYAVGMAVMEPTVGDAPNDIGFYDSVWQFQEAPNYATSGFAVYGRFMGEPSLRGNLDLPYGNIAVDRGRLYQVERSSTDVAMLAGVPASLGRTDVVTANRNVTQGGDIVRTTTPVLFPKNLTGFDAERVYQEFSATTDGTQYVVMAFPATGCEDAACPSLINVQQVKQGRVTWSRVWRTGVPVRLEHISANNIDVVILMSAGAANPDTPAAFPQLTRVRNDGVVLERYRVPLEGWRRDWAQGTPEERYALIPNLKYISTDDTGRITANNENFILSGSFSEAFPNVYLLDRQLNPPVDRGRIVGPVAFAHDYLYASGTTDTGFGNPQKPPRAANDPASGNSGYFLLPLDFELNERAVMSE